MANQSAFFREQILSLNIQPINSKIAMGDHRGRVNTCFATEAGKSASGWTTSHSHSPQLKSVHLCAS